MNRGILIVDDDEVLGQILSRLLAQQGFRVFRATTAGQAMALSRKQHFQLALLDLCLPDGNGLELAEALNRLSPTLAVILMTAYPLRLQGNPKVNHGSVSLLTKPLDLAELRQTVEAALSVAVNP